MPTKKRLRCTGPTDLVRVPRAPTARLEKHAQRVLNRLGANPRSSRRSPGPADAVDAPSEPATESKQPEAFDVQAFLDSTGVKRRIVDVSGEPTSSSPKAIPVTASVHPEGWREDLGALEDGATGGRGDAGPRRLLWRRRLGGATRPHGERDRDHWQHHPRWWTRTRWCACCTSSTRCLIGSSRHLLARTIRIEEDLVDQLFNSSEKRLARKLLLLARYGEHDTPDAEPSRRSRRRRWRKWSARRDRA